MAKVTTKTLFQNIKEEIASSVPYTSVSRLYQQTGRGNYSPVAYNDISSSINTVNISEVINAIQNTLSDTLPQFIQSGLEVFAGTPPSRAVSISAGSASVGGILYTLNSDTVVEIPIETLSEIYYIMLWRDGIFVDQQPDKRKVILAKVIVPKPGISHRVLNTNDNSGDAYIQMFREQKLYGYGTHLEEDSIALLRENIGEILADNLIGNLRLSEDLKITNTQGTLELNSNSLKFNDRYNNLLAKYDTSGIHYYDGSGVEVARFTTNDARIGNILILNNSIKSSNFVSGNNGQGFEINDNGSATFENILIRGELRSAVFRQDEIQVSNGDILVTNGTILEQPLDTSSNTVYIKQAVFQDNDILVLKKETQREFLKITAGGGTTTLTVTRNFDGASGTSPSSWTKGDVIVEYGDRVSIVSHGDYAENTPYIDIIDRIDQDALVNECLRVRLGNLNGITDTDFDSVGGVDGYGLYTDRAFLNNANVHGNLTVTGGAFNPTGAGLYAGGCYLGYYDSSAWKSYIDCAGNISFGDASGGQSLSYNSTTGVFRLDSIGGTCCVEIKDGSVRANEMYLIDPACDCNYSYLTAGGWYFHDTLGNETPYVKRLCSGYANNGSIIELCGWCISPTIQVGIKELNSYDANYSVSTQRWCIYNSVPQYFCTAPDCWGYCFGVYACLILAAGLYAECIHDVAVGTSVYTNSNTCASTIRTQWQLWCFCSTCSSCYGYGTACYRICYRCDASGCTWCYCDYSFTMPHATLGQMQSNTYDTQTIDFGANGTYEIQVCLASATAWTLTTFSGVQLCCCCRTINPSSADAYCTWSGSVYIPPYTITCTFISGAVTNISTLSGSNPSNIYCTYMCICYATYISVGVTGGGYNVYSLGYNMGCHSSTCLFCRGGIHSSSCYLSKNMDSFNAGGVTGINLVACFCTQGDNGCITAVNTCQRLATCNGSYLIQCYCLVPSNVACENIRLYGTTDCAGADTCLDGSGVVNWFATSYL